MSLQTGLLELGWNVCSNVQSDSKMKNIIFIKKKAVVEHVLNKAGLVQVQLYKVLLNLIKFFFDKIVNDNSSYMATSRNRLSPLWVGKKFYYTQSCVDKEYEEFLKWFAGKKKK